MLTGCELGRPLDILLVEDSPSDALLTREALKQGLVPKRVHYVEDGVQALEFLRREGVYGNAPRPDLMLLDLKFPRMNGCELLREIRGDRGWRHLPVIVLTTSSEEGDAWQAYGSGASCFISKPVDVDLFFEAMKALDRFWFTWVSLPAAERP